MNVIRKFLEKLGYLLIKKRFSATGYSFENDITRLIKLEEVKQIVDVGAHEGNLISRFIDLMPAAKAYAIEPSPKSFSILSKRFENSSRLTLVNKGVSDIEGVLELAIFQDNELNNFRKHHKLDNLMDLLKVDVTTLDNIFFEKASIDFLKIDVEGFEMKVLQGASKLLKSNKIGMIYIECGFDESDEGHTYFVDIMSMLKKYGFVFYALYDLYHYRRRTELLFANALFINEDYLASRSMIR